MQYKKHKTSVEAKEESGDLSDDSKGNDNWHMLKKPEQEYPSTLYGPYVNHLICKGIS